MTRTTKRGLKAPPPSKLSEQDELYYVEASARGPCADPGCGHDFADHHLGAACNEPACRCACYCSDPARGRLRFERRRAWERNTVSKDRPTAPGQVAQTAGEKGARDRSYLIADNVAKYRKRMLQRVVALQAAIVDLDRLSPIGGRPPPGAVAVYETRRLNAITYRRGRDKTTTTSNAPACVAWCPQDRPHGLHKSLSAYVRRLYSCGRSHVEGIDSQGHVAAVKLCCNGSMCGCGGTFGGETSDGEPCVVKGAGVVRRANRAAPKLDWSQSWVQVVVTMPTHLRDRYRSKSGIGHVAELTYEVCRVIRPDAIGAMIVVHEFGEESPGFAPHGHALMPLPPGAKFMTEPDAIEKGKRKLEALLGLEEGKANLHVSFAHRFDARRDNRAHKLRYAVRDTTMGTDKDGAPWFHGPDMSADDLVLMLHTFKGLRRVRWFGQLSNRKWKAFERSEMVQNGRKKYGAEEDPQRRMERGACPCCGEAMSWLMVRDEPEPSFHPLERPDFHVLGGSPYLVDDYTWECMQAREPTETTPKRRT